jgi:Neurotransmitter-gated ion-channel ligand binding domain
MQDLKGRSSNEVSRIRFTNRLIIFYCSCYHALVDFVLLADAANPNNMSDEKRLIKKLLGDYEKVGLVGRPVFNQSETIKVKYGLSLIQILDLDEKNQVLTTNCWSRYVSSVFLVVKHVAYVLVNVLFVRSQSTADQFS